jgi:hypothetical protein
MTMGGGSSYSGPSLRSTSEAEGIFKSAVEEAKQSSYQANLNSYFQDLLSDFNNRNVDQINSHLQTIEDALSSYGMGSVNLIYGGSVKKHTYVDGLSDVDVLAIINNTSLVDASPRQVLEYFADRLRDRLPNTEIGIGNLAVTLKFSDGHEIQVLPAISTPSGVHISSANGTDWSGVVRPDKFAGKLTNVNQSNSGKVVPVIKLYKTINAGLPEGTQLSGYHIESLAIDAFKNYQGNMDYRSMLMHFVDHASKAVLNPVKDSTGQSIHVDDYLGNPESNSRRNASSALQNVAARMKQGDSEASLERWKELVEG